MILTLFAFLTRFFYMILGISTPQSFPPPLPAKEEQECFFKKAKGDETARQRLILHNLRLVAHVVRKYYASARNPEELVSIGTIGLVKAVDTFRIENGARFATMHPSVFRKHFSKERSPTLSELIVARIFDMRNMVTTITH